MNLWGSIGLCAWRRTPCLRGAIADEADVKAGRAVFYFGNPEEIDARPETLELPALGIETMDDGSEMPVVVIQAERTFDRCMLGVRYLTGGNGICLLGDVEVVDESDPRLRMHDPH